MDLVTHSGANIDLKKNVLYTKNGPMPLYFKQNSYSYTLPPRSQKIIKAPIISNEVNQGIIEYLKLTEGIEIPQCLVRVENNEAYLTVTNSNETEKQITINPLKILEINDSPTTVIQKEEKTDNLLKENMKNLRLEHLNKEEKEAIRKICFEYRDIFHCKKLPLSFTNVVKHEIRTTDEIPIFQKAYRMPETQKKEVERQVEDLLKNDIIQPSCSPWSSPVIVVPKKIDASGEQKYRPCVDYRLLNKKRINDQYI